MNWYKSAIKAIEQGEDVVDVCCNVVAHADVDDIMYLVGCYKHGIKDIHQFNKKQIAATCLSMHFNFLLMGTT